MGVVLIIANAALVVLLDDHDAMIMMVWLGLKQIVWPRMKRAWQEKVSYWQTQDVESFCPMECVAMLD